MKESGLIDNMLQDLLQYERELNRFCLLIVANQLKAKQFVASPVKLQLGKGKPLF